MFSIDCLLCKYALYKITKENLEFYIFVPNKGVSFPKSKKDVNKNVHLILDYFINKIHRDKNVAERLEYVFSEYGIGQLYELIPEDIKGNEIKSAMFFCEYTRTLLL